MNNEIQKFTGMSLESSQRCNLSCPHCVMRTYENLVTRIDMGMEVVEAVIQDFPGLESIDFTGWGEPLINPGFDEILRKVRSNFSGRMSFTTNGLLFTRKLIDACIEQAVDIICFSTDAVDKKGYSRMRPQGKFKSLRNIIKEFVSRKGKKARPGLYATYLLQRNNYEKAPEFVRMASKLGMDGVVFQLMTGVYSEEGRAQITYRNYYETDFNEGLVHEALAKASQAAPRGFTVVLPEFVQPSRVHDCGGFDIKKPFIAASGDVTACCAMAYPVELMTKQGNLVRRKPQFFGNVLQKPLPQIWSSPEYVAFREEIYSGGSPRACNDCIGLYIRPPGGGHT
jgi:MoaA/NifB/PqqE/SkfB family radical SAM enzyme